MTHPVGRWGAVVSGASLPQTVAPTALSPEDPAAEQFRSALETPVPADGLDPGATPDRRRPTAGASLGDSILEGVKSLSERYQEAATIKSDLMAKDPRTWSVAEVFLLQTVVQESQVCVELLSSAVKKVEQSVEQLIKSG